MKTLTLNRKTSTFERTRCSLRRKNARVRAKLPNQSGRAMPSCSIANRGLRRSTLTFRFWQFCQLRDENYVGLEEGIFHDDELGAKELGVLRKYAKVTKPETLTMAANGCVSILAPSLSMKFWEWRFRLKHSS